MDLHNRYPALSDLRILAKKRVPHFVWEFLDSGTGEDRAKARNRAALDDILLMPSILHGEITPDLSIQFLDRVFELPFGIAPVGMSGLVWPGAEKILARTAEATGIPYCMSTAASQTPEDIQGTIGEDAWFQLYPPRDLAIRADILKRIEAAGFTTLVLTVDLPVGSRRERMVRSGLTQPPALTPRILAQISRCPVWAMAMARAGMPRMRLIDDYAGKTKGLSSTNHAGYLMRTSPDWDYLRWLRDAWSGPFVIKGVLNPKDATRMQEEGIDAIWVSNHGGRQMDAAPASISQLPKIRAACDLPLIFDSGVESGLDVLRAVALGADMVMLGRGWHYALGALGASGPSHLAEIMREDVKANMGQLGLSSLSETQACLLSDE